MTVSRKACRAQLAGLLSTNVADLVAVYDHMTKDFGRVSPVAMVASNGSRYNYSTKSIWYRFVIVLLWQRADDANTENYMDDLAEDVRGVIDDNDELANYWRDCRILEEFSLMDYAEVDGVQYRLEELTVEVWPV